MAGKAPTQRIDGAKPLNLAKSDLEPSTFAVTGMSCSACVNSVERALNSLAGVSASVNFAAETVHILAPSDLNPELIIKTIKSAGYGSSLLKDADGPALSNRRAALALFFAALFAIPSIAISMTMSWHSIIDARIIAVLDHFKITHPLYSPSGWLVIAITTPLIIFVAWPIHRAALRNFFHPTMDSLISLGSIAAFTWSVYANATGAGDVYTEVSSGVIFFVILGRYLEVRAKRRASSALKSLLALGSKEVIVIRNGTEVLIPIEHLKIGDEFIVKSGERIATDGIVISGNSSVDNSMITGESFPVELSPGSPVIGAALNNNGRVIVRATRIGADTELARITAMVVSAQGNKAPIQRLADRISSVFVPVVTTLAIATFFLWRYAGDGHSLTRSISVAITVLVIACPCALGLATPIALLVASGRGAARGIVLRQPRVLEIARKIDVVVFDKTGTLTMGAMKVQEVTIPTSAQRALGKDLASVAHERTILTTALALESANNHPIGQAISSYAIAHGARKAEVLDFVQTPGSGVAGRVSLENYSPVVLIGSPKAIAHSAIAFDSQIASAIASATSKGLSISVLAWDGVALAVFATGDVIKADSAETIGTLQSRGIQSWLMTGDSQESADAMAITVGIDPSRVIAAALPEDKLSKISELQRLGHRVLMVGDGINDAAALAAADLSMAMGTGTDAAISTADITLMRPGLMSIVDALDLSKKTLRTIKVNLGWAFSYNVIGLPIAVLGLLSPMYAAGAMALSSLFVVINSLRIK